MSRKKEYETLVFVLDVGSNMNELVPGENCTFFEQSIKCIEWIVQRKIFSDSKDEIALVLFGTQDTQNQLAENNQYQHVTKEIDLGAASWQFLQKVKKVQLSTISGDFVDALVVAFDLLYKQTEGKPVSARKIVFLSNFGGDFDPDESNTIIKGLKTLHVNLNVIGPDFDNMLDGSQMKEKHRHEAQKLMKSILEKTEGECYSFSDAIPQLTFYQTKDTRSTPWNVNLDIGENLQIPVSSYVKIKEFRPKSFKSCYARDVNQGLTTVTSYHKNDEAQTEVEEEEEITKAYKYGSTIVPFSKEDLEHMKYNGNKKCLSVMGFTKQENIKVHYYSSTGCRVVVAKKDDEAAACALSALINALYETNMVAIVRYCYSDRSGPKMGFLSPIIKNKYEALVLIILPFAEDIRNFTFPSLTEANEDQLKAVDELITCMNLRPKDEEEKLKSSSILNPSVQRNYQCIAHRALNSNDLIPKVEERFLEKLTPNVEMTQNCKSIIDRLNRVFSLKEIEKKKKKRGAFADLDDDVDNSKKPRLHDSLAGGIADLIQGPVQSIGTVTPVEDFESLLKQNKKTSETICREMLAVIRDLVMKSFGAQMYDKALSCVKALRKEACKVAFEPYNDFLNDVKSNYASKGRKEFWNLLKDEKITLISSEENSKSGVSVEEANKFLEEEEEVSELDETIDEDQDDLLDMV